MLGAREYVPCRVERQGNVASKYIYHVECSRCDSQLDWPSRTKWPDDQLKKQIEKKGWVLGRSRKHDLCPACVSGPKLADRFKTTRDGEPVKPQTEETLELLDKHFPMAEAPPKPPKLQQSGTVQPLVIQSGMSPEMSYMLVQTMRDISQAQDHNKKDMAECKAALELMVDQQSTLVKQNAQLINAIANIVPTLHRLQDGLTSQLDRIAQATVARSVIHHVEEPAPPPPQTQAAPLAERPAKPTPPVPDVALPLPPVPVDHGAVVAQPEPEPVSENLRKFKNTDVVYMTACQPPSAGGKYFTNINVKSELADWLGFHEASRVMCSRVGDTIILELFESEKSIVKGVAKIKAPSKAYRCIQTFVVGDGAPFGKGKTEIEATPGKLKVRLV